MSPCICACEYPTPVLFLLTPVDLTHEDHSSVSSRSHSANAIANSFRGLQVGLCLVAPNMTTPYNYGVSASSGIAASPRRHRHAVQPPNLLTTSLENARASLGIGAVSQTPISTTSLSSPFAASAYPLSPNPASPGSAMRGTSPMTFRSQAGISSAYNPQHWGPVGNEIPVSTTRSTRGQSSRTTVFTPQPVGPDGKEDTLIRGTLTDREHHRACCFPTSTLLSSSRWGVPRLTTPSC